MTATQGFSVDDPEVEFLYTQHPDPVECQICSRSLDHLTLEERTDHYSAHFAEQEMQSTGSDSREWYPGRGGKVPGTSSATSKLVEGKLFLAVPLSNDLFWHPYLTTQPPKNYTPGLIPILRRALIKLSSKNSITQRAVLCTEGVTHISGQGMDRLWTCGYRNFLMASCALAAQDKQPMYYPLLDGDPSCGPGVRNLQRWIEDAWRQGYDSIGAQQLKNRLVGTSKWIGTGELYVAFSYKGIPSRLVDFPRSKNTSRDTSAALARWVVDYFSSSPDGSSPTSTKHGSSAFDVLKTASPVTISPHMPLVLQHNGHSRTIVGYELTRSGAINLLIFDPAKSIKTPVRKAALAAHVRAMAKRSASSQTQSQTSTSSSSSSPSSGQKVKDKLSKLFHHQPITGASKLPTPLNLKRVFDNHTNNHDPIEIEDSEDECEGRRKRVRGGQNSAEGADEVEEIVPPAKRASSVLTRVERYPEEEELDPSGVANFFRVNISQLSKNAEYQILYFPLTDPLTEYQKERQKVVTSERVVS